MKLRFSIRDLIVVTIIVALAVGWYLDSHQRYMNRINAAKAAQLKAALADPPW